MSRPEINPPQARNWRDIPQQVKPRAMSSEGRKRLVFSVAKSVAAVAVIGGLAWGGWQLVSSVRGQAPAKAMAEQEVPVKEVILATDGVLDHKWLVRTLAIPKNATLMQLDLYRLRAQLMASGQVRAATLTRNFPATLSVSISEESPVVRVKTQFGGDEPRTLLVARDGTIFDGVGFDPAMIETLPWLDGVKLERQGDRFAPIGGMELVGDLLGKAKLEAEHLYRTWKVVSLARLETDREIEIHAADVARISFGSNEDFFRQLARLDTLLDKARATTDQPIREINLAIGSQVPVAFEEPVLPEGAKATVKPAAAKLLPTAPRPANPNLSRKQKL